MKLFLLSFFVLFGSSSLAVGQESPLSQEFLFDEEDVVVRAQISDDEEIADTTTSEAEITNAVNQAKNLLNKKPVALPKIDIPELKKLQKTSATNQLNTQNLKEAPFGLFWGANQSTTLNQGIELQRADLKDYVNSFLATSLPKPIAFFDRIYVVFGKDDELYRILSYSQLMDDDSSAKKTLDQYNKYSQLLEKK